MSATHDTGKSPAGDEGGGLDPREAARILEQTAIQARRQFEPSSPPS